LNFDSRNAVQEVEMLSSNRELLSVGVAAIALAIGTSQFAFAQSATRDVVGEIANNEGYFVDGKTFKIVKGKAGDDAAALFAKLEKMGAREAGPGITVFRYADKLYILEGPAQPSPQAMKSFQDNWNVSYMKGMKDFQDNFAQSYMKDFQSGWNVSYMKDNDNAKDANASYMKAMKDFQDNWNQSYMKALNDFQSNWNVSYMKNQQDNWNVSYMKAVKDFQDNWSTSYMK
jgi:hypothetical protein